MKLNKAFLFIYAIFIVLFISSCSNGACNTNTTPPETGLYTFVNGSVLSGQVNATVIQGESSTPLQFSLKGGSPKLTVSLSTELQLPMSDKTKLNDVGVTCNSVCGEFNPSDLEITTTNSESSSTLVISSASDMPPGTYLLNLKATYVYNGQVYYDVKIGQITVTVLTNPNPAPTPVEQGVVIINGTPSIQNGFVYSTAPSTGNWQKYQSGTTGGITAVATNDFTTLAIHQANGVSESAGFILSNNGNGKFVNYNLTVSQQAIGGLSSILVASNNLGYVVLSSGNPDVGTYFISNSGNVTTLGAPFSSLSVDALTSLDGKFYVFDSTHGEIWNSTDGVNWTQVSGVTIPAKFTKVVEIGNSVYAAMSDNGKVYLGSSPSAIVNEQTLSYTAKQIASNKDSLVIASVEANGNGQAYFYHPSSSNLGSSYKEISISLTNYIPVDASKINSYTITGLFVNDSSVYAIGKGTIVYGLFNNPKLSAVISGNIGTGQTGIAAIVDTKNNTYSNLTGALQYDNLVVANTGAGIQGNIINNVSSPKYSNNGSIALIKNVNYSIKGQYNNNDVTYDSLPTGSKYVEFMGLAGDSTDFALVLKNGSTVSYSNGVFTSGSTILNTTVSPRMPDTIAGIAAANYTLLAYANATNNQAAGSGNIYVSPDNGISWTAIPVSSFPKANNQGTIVGATVKSIGESYVVSTFDANNNVASYQTGTPTNLISWVNLNAPANSSLSFLNDNLFAFNTNSSAYSYESSNVWNNASYSLPANFVATNIAYGNGQYALAESSTSIVWSESNIYSGNNWVSNNVLFYVSNSVFPGKTFSSSPTIIWTGKTWVANDNALFVYTSNNMVDYYVSSISNDQTSWFVGTPTLF